MLKKFLLITLLLLATTSLASAVTQEVEFYLSYGVLVDYEKIELNNLIKQRNQNGWRLVSITHAQASVRSGDEGMFNYNLILLFEK